MFTQSSLVELYGLRIFQTSSGAQLMMGGGE